MTSLHNILHYYVVCQILVSCCKTAITTFAIHGKSNENIQLKFRSNPLEYYIPLYKLLLPYAIAQ